MGDASNLQILAIGLEPGSLALLKEAGQGVQIVNVPDGSAFEQQFESWADGVFAGILCGPTLKDVMPNTELAQVLQNQCPDTPKYFMTYDTSTFEPRNLTKNGFNTVFFLPMDKALFTRALVEDVIAEAVKRRAYRSVRLFDLEPGSVLDFETWVYLPLNRKYVRFSAAGQVLDAEKIEKLKSHNMNLMYVEKSDMDKFYKYSSDRLRKLGQDDGGGTATEKAEKLRDCIRALFTDIFDISIKGDFDEGRQMIMVAQSIISNYITKGGSSDWYDRLLAAIGEGQDGYSHASDVSTFAALFAIGLGHPRPEDLAMAGLFHDLGLIGVPEELYEKPLEKMTEKEREAYMAHPEKSVLSVKGKRLIITPEVERAIQQHHERYDGKGFPKQLPANKISEEAQILSFADQFDYLTRVQAGQKRLSPIEAWEAIQKTGSIGPELCGRIGELLRKQVVGSATPEPNKAVV